MLRASLLCIMPLIIICVGFYSFRQNYFLNRTQALSSFSSKLLPLASEINATCNAKVDADHVDTSRQLFKAFKQRLQEGSDSALSTAALPLEAVDAMMAHDTHDSRAHVKNYDAHKVLSMGLLKSRQEPSRGELGYPIIHLQGLQFNTSRTMSQPSESSDYDVCSSDNSMLSQSVTKTVPSMPP